MLNKKYLYILAGAFAVIAVIQSCKKNYLDIDPQGSLNDVVLANKVGVEGLLIGAYAKLGGSQNWGSAPSNWVFGSVVADEAYKGSTPSDQPDINQLEPWAYNNNNGYFNEKWINNYNGIGRVNETLRTIPKAADLTADEVKRITAEARFLRGFYHFELKKIFNYIPFVDETITGANGNTNVSNIDASGNFIDIWPQIEADFQFAADNLPATQPQTGRANKWAALAFLAKTYMYQDKYAEAKPLLESVISTGTTAGGKKYMLVNYFSNFNPAQDNNEESIFAYQASVNDGSGTNGNYGDNLNYPNSGGPGGCCGFFTPSITMANAYKTGDNGLPLLDTYNSGSDVGKPVGGYTGSLDPRIDLAMGRKGIPYLDWGPHPGESWIRDPGSNGYFSVKKTVYAKSQANIVSSETSFWGPTQMDAGNVSLMRFADVILWAAEVENEIGDPALALNYVNMIRNRAANPVGWVYKNSDYDAATATYKTRTTPADNYQISPYPAGAFANKEFARKAIMFERWLELSEEGQRFFDLQRWDNGTGLMANVLNAYKAAEVSRPSFFVNATDAVFNKGLDEFYPLPQAQIDQANSGGTVVLKQNR